MLGQRYRIGIELELPDSIANQGLDCNICLYLNLKLLSGVGNVHVMLENVWQAGRDFIWILQVQYSGVQVKAVAVNEEIHLCAKSNNWRSSLLRTLETVTFSPLLLSRATTERQWLTVTYTNNYKETPAKDTSAVSIEIKSKYIEVTVVIVLVLSYLES